LLRGAGGAPSVDLLAPDGTPVVPTTDQAPGDKRVRLVTIGSTTSLQFKDAPAGTWTAVPRAGSAAIGEVLVAEAAPVPKVTGKVRGKGARKTLTYRVRGGAAGTTVLLQERWNGGARLLRKLPAGARKGKLRLRFDRGPAGPRTVIAVATRGSVTAAPQTVTRYRAPARQTLRAVKRLRVKGKGATWKRSPGAATVTVLATLKSGRTVVRQLPGRATRAKLGSTVARVTVTPREATGRAGKAASAKAPKAKKRTKGKKGKRKR
jgi:hypothetical protein